MAEILFGQVWNRNHNADILSAMIDEDEIELEMRFADKMLERYGSSVDQMVHFWRSIGNCKPSRVPPPEMVVGVRWDEGLF